MPMFDEILDCLGMVKSMMEQITVNENILSDSKYDYIFSVEEVNRLTTEGMPFRDAYRKVGLDIEAGKFTPHKEINHTHEGSIGNLCNSEIAALMESVLAQFPFEKVNAAEQSLLVNR